MDELEENLEKSEQAAQLLHDDLRQLHKVLLEQNPLAAEMFLRTALKASAELKSLLESLSAFHHMRSK